MKTRLLFIIIIYTFAISIKSACAATTYTWKGGASGSWTTAANWSVGGSTASVYPGSTGTTDLVVINTSNASVTLSGTITIGNITISSGISGITISVSSGFALNINNGITTGQPSSAAVSLTFSGSGTTSIGGTVNAGYNSSFAISPGGTVNFNANAVFDESTGNPHGNLTNNGTLNIASGCTFKFGDFSSFVNTGTVSALSSTFVFSGSGTPASLITNNGTFNATSSTFTLNGSNAGIQNTSSSSVFTSNACTFNISNNGSVLNRIYNTSIFIDHASTINIAGSGNYIQNAGNPGLMYLRGTSINTTGSNDGISNTSFFFADSTATITLGASQDYISNTGGGVFYAGVSGTACTINLTGLSANVTNGNGNVFYLGSTSIIYPTAASTAITNSSSGTFTLQSDANGSAAIGPLSATSSCTGTFNVERYFQGSTTYDNVKGRWLGRNYRVISSPVNTGTKVNNNYIYGLNYIVGSTAGQTTAASSSANVFITGCTGGSTSAGNPSIYLYNEANTPANSGFTGGNFIGINNITSASAIGTSAGTGYTIPIGNGVLFFFRGAATNWSARTSAPFIAPENVTLTSTGNINQQSVTVKDWYSPTSSNLGYTGTGTTGNYAVRGFNMVGNPYPCTIDWETVNTGGISVTNINPTIYKFNPVTNQYDTYSSFTHIGNTITFAGKIASGEGFFVQANAANPALTFTEQAKSATSILTGNNLYMGTPLAQSVPQVIRLKLIKDSLNYDNTVLVFNTAASTKFNQAEDSPYLTGINAIESLSTFSADNVPISINSLPLPKQGQNVIRLNVTGKVNGSYTLQRTALDAIPQMYEVWLMDKYKRDSLDLRNNSSYIFDINLSDTTTYGNNRFQIVIRRNPALGVHLLSFTAAKSSAGSQITWQTENEQNYTNFTVERSTDNGVTFAVIGGLVSNAQGTYSLLDKNPVNGSDQYRLKIEDLNDAITYSNVVTLNYGDPGTLINNISVYPNPAKGIINLSVTQNSNSPSSKSSAPALPKLLPDFAVTPGTIAYDIKIISITGSVIKTAISTSANWQDNVSTLTPGTYIIQVVNKSDNSLVGKSTFIKI